MAEGDQDKPLELNYARPEENRSFQDALTEFVKREEAEGNLAPVSRPQLLLQAISTLGIIIALFVAALWCAYRFRR